MHELNRSPSTFLVCVEDKGYEVSLERRKVYVAISDSMALKHGHVRVIDESGEDYLYPSPHYS